jgi:hypothetical protein
MKNAKWSPTHWYSLPSAYGWCLFLFAIIAGVRYNVGVDYLTYLNYYNNALGGLTFIRERGIEEGYIFVTSLFAYLGLHPVFYFGFLAVLQLIFILWAFRLEREIVPFLLVLIMLGGYFFTWMNGIRQMIAACSFVWSIKFIKDKKPIKYTLCVIFAYLWHHSALFLIPFYLFAYDKLIWKRSYINLFVFFLCYYIGSSPFWVTSFSGYRDIILLSGYDNYVEMTDNLLNPENFHSFNWGPRMISKFIINVIIIYTYPKIRSLFIDTNFDLLFKFFLIGVCFYNLFMNVGSLFLRPSLYFTLFTLPMTAFTMVGLLKNRSFLLFAILSICSLSYTFISCMVDIANPQSEQFFLYKFYFFANV